MELNHRVWASKTHALTAWLNAYEVLVTRWAPITVPTLLVKGDKLQDLSMAGVGLEPTTSRL